MFALIGTFYRRYQDEDKHSRGAQNAFTVDSSTRWPAPVGKRQARPRVGSASLPAIALWQANAPATTVQRVTARGFSNQNPMTNIICALPRS